MILKNEKPYTLPKIAPHLLQYTAKTKNGKRTQSTVDENLQPNVNSIVEKYHERLRQNQVHNEAVLVLGGKTREVLTYVGNARTDKAHQKDVDMVQANRSTGSTIKPLLYATMCYLFGTLVA